MLINNLGRLTEGCDTIVDIGCGTSRPPLLTHPAYLVGVDGYRRYLTTAKQKRTHDDFVLADVRRLPFRRKSVDGALALDVIEHLPKLEGENLIKDMEAVARKRVIILTPNGPNPKGELEDANPLQAHLSEWVSDDFRRLGYRVSGRRGLRILRGEHAVIRFRPRFLWGAVSYLTQPLAKFRPELGFHLMAYKELQQCP